MYDKVLISTLLFISTSGKYLYLTWRNEEKKLSQNSDAYSACILENLVAISLKHGGKAQIRNEISYYVVQVLDSLRIISNNRIVVKLEIKEACELASWLRYLIK